MGRRLQICSPRMCFRQFSIKFAHSIKHLALECLIHSSTSNTLLLVQIDAPYFNSRHLIHFFCSIRLILKHMLDLLTRHWNRIHLDLFKVWDVLGTTHLGNHWEIVTKCDVYEFVPKNKAAAIIFVKVYFHRRLLVHMALERNSIFFTLEWSKDKITICVWNRLLFAFT